MGRRGNPHRKPKGIPEGGQFASNGEGYLVRMSPMESDIKSYLDNSAAGNRDPLYRRERERNIKRALYDGGYAHSLNGDLNEPVEDTESFIGQITTEHATTEAWRDRKGMVDTYLKVAKGYFDNDNFDLVIDGHYSDGRSREATELMREFGWSKQEIGKILLEIKPDDFVNSGANNSRYEANRGTVVMVFAPRIKVMDKIEGEQEIDLYVKMVLNPHPDRSRNQTEMQVLSFREAKDKTCLYTGEVRTCRR